MIGANHVTRATLAQETQFEYRHKRKEGRVVKLDIKFAPVIVFCSKRWLARRHSPAERRAPRPRHAKKSKKRKTSAKTRRDAETVPISLSPQRSKERTTQGELAPSSAQFCAPSKTILRYPQTRRPTHSTPCQKRVHSFVFCERLTLAQCFVKAARDLCCCFWTEGNIH